MIATVNISFLRLAKALKTNLIIVGKNADPKALLDQPCLEIHRVDSIEDILQHDRIDDIDEIMICESFRQDSQLNLLIYLLNKLKINVSFTPNLYAKLLSGRLNNENALKSIATTLGRKSDHEECLIRLLDIAGALFMLIIAIVPMIAIAILIKLASEGPIFYSQERAGKNGKSFLLYKFRTMHESTANISDLTPAVNGDSRITKSGHFLRQTRLDELPQLINVLKSDMSLVGPRPENFYRVQKHKSLQGLRMAIKPGLTGLAQVRSCYDLLPKHKVRYDYLYIQRRSFWLNIDILLKTVPVILSKKGQ
ncbi:sugar transferase [Candidatus Pacearchaeota archaeon]|nr:sugar transferase [Candidatus Pacearchaeota archaeon]